MDSSRKLKIINNRIVKNSFQFLLTRKNMNTGRKITEKGNFV